MDVMNAAESLRGLVEKAQRVLLTGPDDVDGDSLGSSLALARVLRAQFGVEVEVAGEAGPRYAWMPGANENLGDNELGDYDLVVVLDGDRHRLPEGAARAFAKAGARAIVDHHGSTRSDGYDVAVLDPDAASTCEMVLELADAWGASLDPELSTLLYVGIIFDTGGFRYSNTSPSTHRAAARLLATGISHADIAIRILMERSRAGTLLKARLVSAAQFHADGRVALGICDQATLQDLGANPHDIDGIVESLLYIEGVEMGVLATERGPDRVKLSLRSRGSVDVAALAQELHPSGGGHAKAAGVVLNESIASVRESLASRLSAVVERLSP